MHLPRLIMALFGLASLTCCALLPHPADSQVVSLAEKVGAEASTFFTELAARSAKDCALSVNSEAYYRLAELAEALKLHIAVNHGSPALVLASATSCFCVLRSSGMALAMAILLILMPILLRILEFLLVI